MKTIRKYREGIALTAVLFLAGFLSIYNIWNLGYSNEFYAASVKSMLTSWKNFFFVSLDPGGWVTVDKPPVSLWIQAAFAKAFGFYGWSIILPQCLAAVGTVAVIYHVVKHRFGSAAGLISALVLALSPIFIVISKTNNTDSILIFFMALSVWAMSAAIETERLRYLLLSMVLLGVAYNAKTLEAFLILPALFAAYFFGTSLKWRKRLGHLALATLVLAVVSLSWSVIVDLTPADARPYVDNSTNNSELELELGYNGIQRIIGQSFRRSAGAAKQSGNEKTGNGAQNGQAEQAGSSPFAASQEGTASGRNAEGTRSGSENGFQGMPGGNGGGNSMFNGGGSASPLRMFNTTLGGQDSWLLPFGLISLLALLLGMRKSAGADEETRRKLRYSAILWGGSVVTMVGYFSVAQFFHPYYLSVMAPFLAALVGIGLTELWKQYRAGTRTAWLLPIAFIVTMGVQTAMLISYPEFSKILIPLVCVLTGIPAVLLAAGLLRRQNPGKLAAACVAVGLAGLLAAPAVWTAYSVFRNSFNSSIPSAGPSAQSSGMMDRTGRNMSNMPSREGGSQWKNGRTGAGDGTGNGGGLPSFGAGQGNHDQSSSSDTKLIQFLEKNAASEKFLIAVPSAREAEPIILATGKPVMAIGGFSGNDKTLTIAKLQQMVKDGELKYFLVSGGRGEGSSSDEVTQWVEKNGKAVASSEWSSSSGSTGTADGRMENSSQTLYDLSSFRSK